MLSIWREGIRNYLLSIVSVSIPTNDFCRILCSCYKNARSPQIQNWLTGLWSKDQKCIVFALLTSTHEILNTYIHIHNGPLQFFSQDYGLGSHTTHVVCVNWSLKSILNDRYFDKLSMANIFASKVFARNFPRRSRRRNIFMFSCLPGIWTRSLRLISQQSTYWVTAHRVMLLGKEQTEQNGRHIPFL